MVSPDGMLLKLQIDSFLEKVNALVESEHIQSEANIAERFRVWSQQEIEFGESQYGVKKAPTLLEILGYTSGDVEDRPVKRTVIGQTTYSPDYILKRQQKMLAIVDLKAPDQNLDHPRWLGQIHSYCSETNVPLGLLFNGTAVRVLINTNYKGLSKHKALFFDQYVASSGSHDRKQMVDIFLKFAASVLEASPITVANSFASTRRRELRDGERQRNIQDQLTFILENPSKLLFSAISTVDDIWSNIVPKPSEGEVESAWQHIQMVSHKKTARKPLLPKKPMAV